jgi:hypothetical protein
MNETVIFAPGFADDRLLLGAALQATAARRPPSPLSSAAEWHGRKRLSISAIFAAPLPFELPAIMWLRPVELALDTM